jgi:hypothetical protein
VFGAGEVDALDQAVGAAIDHGSAGPGPAPVLDLAAEKLRGIADRYLAKLHSLTADAGRHPLTEHIVDKMPSNFRHVGLIHLVLPNARIIHTCRDPVDTCLSCFSLLFGKLHFTYDLGELGRRYAAYSRLMDHWRAVLPRDAMLDVQYENVVSDPETEIRRILAYCGLDWDDACIRFHEASRPVRTASVAQVRQPIYRHSVGRWRPDPSILRPLIEGLQAQQTDEKRGDASASHRFASCISEIGAEVATIKLEESPLPVYPPHWSQTR